MALTGGTIAGMTVSGLKTELKDTFGNIGYCLYSKANIAPASGKITLPTSNVIEFPVTVDTLSISQDDPTINHYKIVGMTGDWFATSEAGDMTVAMTVPSKAKELVKAFYGTDAVTDVYVGTSSSSNDYSGIALTTNQQSITGSIVLVNEDQTQMMIMNGIQLWAKPQFENPGTEPFAFALTGTMVVDESTSSNFIWLKKTGA